VQSLKIIVYPGLKRLSKQDYELANPSILADADIVITTFPVLNNELYHSDNTFLESGKSLRYTKLYDVVPSPLDSIDWWRICLDEAQRVQGTAAAAAKMALRLKGQQRWCVTGTPIGRGKLDDLYGLLLFIGATPFQHKESFRHCLHGCHPGIEERIKNILYPIFWRSTKANPLVREQLGIPEQIEKKTLLEFSSIERHFYKKQLENTILAVNKPSNAKMKSDDISLRLHSLRAACCHPQVGSSGIHRLGPKKHNAIADRVLSMDQILDKLIDDARLKCEESQRICILHLNALACIAKLKVELKQWVDPPITIEESDEYLLNKSASLYLEALVLSDKNASPSDIIGEAELNGCETFLSPGAIIRDGVAILKWKLNITSEKQICEAKVEFNTGKKLIAFKARPLIVSPTNTSFDTVLIPKECVLQVSLASLGGIFVDVRRFSFKKTLDPETNWITFDSIRTNRSKLWRVLVESYHERKRSGGESSLAFLGIEIHLLEPSIGADDLQRMHILHNSALVVDSLIQSTSSSQNFDGTTSLLTFKAKLKEVNSELTTLESNYLGSAKSCHRTSLFHLERITMRQYELESELRQLSDSSRQILWRDMWWQDLLSWLHMDTGAIIPTSAKESLCFMVKNDLFELFNGPFDVGDSGFPEFGCVFGLQVALKSRKQRGYCEKSLLNEVSRLSENPSEGEILENSCCHKCRADWFQTVSGVESAFVLPL
jgi:E3 ubiquitin-protein ligase SHPRH